jgi:hypothetical protein
VYHSYQKVRFIIRITFVYPLPYLPSSPLIFFTRKGTFHFRDLHKEQAGFSTFVFLVSLFVCSFVYLFIYLFICLLAYLFVCLFICLFSLYRCSTDILLGKNCGLMTLHVGSGVDSLEDIRLWESCESEEQQKLVPDFYAEDLGSLLPFAQELLAQKSSTS